MPEDRQKFLCLSDQAMTYTDGGAGYGEDGLRVPRLILDALPRQIGALRVKLEEAEKAEKSRSRIGATKSSPHPALEKSGKRRPWWENPWLITIIGTVIAALIVAAILGGR